MTINDIFLKGIPVVVALSLCFSGCKEAKQHRPPNVILILSDDQGWGDLSLHGNPNLETPHIDALAKNGIYFDRFFVEPVCSPPGLKYLQVVMR